MGAKGEYMHLKVLKEGLHREGILAMQAHRSSTES
jgi:hypothetical protein